MLRGLIGGAVALFVAGSLAGDARASFILGLGNDGTVYRISTTDATASLFGRNLPNLGPTEGTDALNSPNSLAFDGRFVYGTAFSGAESTVELWRNDGPDPSFATVVAYLPVGGGAFNLATGDFARNSFIYVDRAGALRSFDVTTNTTTTLPSNLGSVPRGDIAVRGELAFVSQGGGSSNISVVNLANPDASSNTTTQSVGVGSFAGLAFAGSDLFGVTGGNGAFSNLYRLTEGTSLLQTAQFIGAVTLNGFGLALTDAAFVPLPAAAWLLLTALGGFFSYQRLAGRASRDRSPATA